MRNSLLFKCLLLSHVLYNQFLPGSVRRAQAVLFLDGTEPPFQAILNLPHLVFTFALPTEVNYETPFWWWPSIVM